jgi:hypothetical protein
VLESWSLVRSFEALKKVKSVTTLHRGNDESRMTNDDLTRSCRPWLEGGHGPIDGTILSKELGLGNAKIGEKGGDDPRDGPSAFACYGVTGRTVATPRAQKLRIEGWEW